MKLADVIRAAIEIGHRNGFVTFDQLDEFVPATSTGPEEIEAVMQALSDEGIDVRDE